MATAIKYGEGVSAIPDEYAEDFVQRISTSLKKIAKNISAGQYKKAKKILERDLNTVLHKFSKEYPNSSIDVSCMDGEFTITEKTTYSPEELYNRKKEALQKIHDKWLKEFNENYPTTDGS